MTKILDCGDIINLSKEKANLKHLKIGISWDLKEGVDADLDVSILVLDESGKLLREDSIVYYNNLKLYDGAIQHSGDVITPGAESDDETIRIDLTKLPTNVKNILAVITIFNKEGSTKTTFGCVKRISFNLSNADTNDVMCTFYLKDGDSRGTAVEMGRLSLENGEWCFTVIGEVISTTHNGLQGVIDKYSSNIIIDKNREKTMSMITPIRHRVIRTRWTKRRNDY